LASPITTASWRAAFGHAREAMAEAYDESHACSLGFNAGSLGCARVTAERDFTPLRWVVHDGGAKVVLLDAGDQDVTIAVFDVQSPNISRPVDVDAATSGLTVPNGGALFSAVSASASVGVIAVPKQRIASLADLARSPEVPTCSKDAASLERLVRLAATWEGARLGSTSITSQRRDSAVKALRACVIGTIAGERWTTAETEFAAPRGRAVTLDSIRNFVTTKPDERGIVSVLFERAEEFVGVSSTEREAIFAEIIGAFIRGPDVRRVASFAFRIATSASRAVMRVENDDSFGGPFDSSMSPLSVRDGLSGLLALPVTLRAARMAVMLVAQIGSRVGNSTEANYARQSTWRAQGRP